MQAPSAYNAGMKSKQAATPIQYTVRSIPAEVDRALRRRAKEEGKSLNSIIVEILEFAAGAAAVNKNRNLEKYFGTWVEDPAFDEVMKDFEQIDEEMWK